MITKQEYHQLLVDWNSAAQRAELALAEPSGSYIAPWSWNDLITYPTLY
ncbi:MAG: hypothetical protein F6K31_14385 [Symploca sp. SIO2G7]|nr:hypothetical protein [Symploca sp. SIO2G7]